ncbi:HAD-IA family hydrolase [Actinoplanes derwentensis]|uniref:HAD-IA family hydrolase n=1 Tax=Actinoplanes derwentensis TaxID=113562 RepID=UPI001E295407|nr:HAD-IA family hydrolase [Actinoplanes derwentensis]
MRWDLSSIAAVLLDMDGTLVDSDKAIAQAWTAWAIEHRVVPAAALAISHGTPTSDVVRALLPGLDETEVIRSVRRQWALQYDDLSDVSALSGAHRLLSTLRRLDLPWAVVTNADATLAAARLGAAGIAAPLLITADDVIAGKPDPEGYLAAAGRLGVPSSACLVVEDSPAGLAAGRAAGMRTAGLRGIDADIPLTNLEQLADLLRSRDATG